MKVPKVTRRRIYAAAPSSCEITWPAKTEPKVGHKYTIQNEKGGAGTQRLVVIAKKELPDSWKATVRIEGDRIHLLGKSGGYTESSQGSIGTREINEEGKMVFENEAVDPEEIERYRSSKEARERFQHEKVEAHGELLGAMHELRSALDAMNPEAKRKASRALWVLRSRLDAAERQLRRDLAA